MRFCVKRTGFTLVELLTVIAIITLLIGILTPSLNRARDEAKKAAIKAQLQSIATGCEMFLNDDGNYPVSNAAELVDPIGTRNWEIFGTDYLQGANLIVDAMVGRDFNGYDPRPSSHDPIYNRWFPNNTRRKPYIDPSGINVSRSDQSIEDAFGAFGPDPANNPATPLIGGITCPVFTDKFGWPVLYYRSNPSATHRSRILPTGWTNGIPNNSYVYNGMDNSIFTSHNDGQATPGHQHEIFDASTPLGNVASGQDDLGNHFADFIRSFRASTRMVNSDQWDTLRPVNAGSFILLTPGRDGVFGTLDDVGNFAVKSEER